MSAHDGQLLERYFRRLERGQPWRWRGQVLESVGQTIESAGPLGLGGRVLRDSGPVWRLRIWPR